MASILVLAGFNYKYRIAFLSIFSEGSIFGAGLFEDALFWSSHFFRGGGGSKRCNIMDFHIHKHNICGGYYKKNFLEDTHNYQKENIKTTSFFTGLHPAQQLQLPSLHYRQLII